MNATMITGTRPLSALLATATIPALYWSFAADGVATINTTGFALPSLSDVGTPTFTGGGLVLNNTSALEYDTADNEALRAVFDLQEGLWLFWSNVSMNAGASGQDHMLSVHAGAGPQARFNVLKGSTHRPDVFLAFDGDSAAVQYAGGSNEFAAATPTNICLLVDNRPGQKQLYRYVNGVSVTGASFAGKGPLSYDLGPTQRVRIGADAAFSAANLFFGTLRRMGCARFEDMPADVVGIVQSLHRRNSVPTVELLLALQ